MSRLFKIALWAANSVLDAPSAIAASTAAQLLMVNERLERIPFSRNHIRHS